jgi:hypothetical protein
MKDFKPIGCDVLIDDGIFEADRSRIEPDGIDKIDKE